MFFGGPTGVMPKLYDAWFKKTRQIEKDIVASAKSALRCDSYTELSNQVVTPFIIFYYRSSTSGILSCL